MTDTRNPLERESAKAQAVAWIARQVRWEQTLAGLRAGRDAEGSPAASREAA